MVDVDRGLYIHFLQLCYLGYVVGVLTNNWIDVTDEQRMEKFFSFLSHHFHAVVESCKEGVRKPDQAVYRIACKRLDADPHEVPIQHKSV